MKFPFISSEKYTSRTTTMPPTDLRIQLPEHSLRCFPISDRILFDGTDIQEKTTRKRVSLEGCRTLSPFLRRRIFLTFCSVPAGQATRPSGGSLYKN
ncbi:hypothetical protein AVEN_62344-1 [Araneus ventricosus]|uniref:Uncharacterized protein n=1 Tax=Araneus ventricosus TaxID=182803 RepID=A0A4Y2K8N1_ARAVE|nr:hypothetical protein AVEN_62344-1 [Araneus ventricosus]